MEEARKIFAENVELGVVISFRMCYNKRSTERGGLSEGILGLGESLFNDNKEEHMTVIDPVQQEQAFKDWMSSCGKSRNTAGQYATILRGTLVKTFKMNPTLKANLFEYGNYESFESINTALRDSPDFISVNARKHNSFSASLNAYGEFLYELIDSDTRDVMRVPENVIDILNKCYVDGLRFDATTLRLLENKVGISIDANIEKALKLIMFKRNDDVYFMPSVATDARTQKKITEIADNWLDEYGCFEISQLYKLFANKLNKKCINDAENFGAFYRFINTQDVRIVEFWGTKTKIVRISKSINNLFSDIAAKIIEITYGEHNGTISEEDLRNQFFAFSFELLACIIKERVVELVKTEINGIVCYQTLDAVGLSDDFSEILAETLEQIEELNLIPTEDVLHAALSIRLGVNFKHEYNIPDDKTYRRLVELYYKCTPKRRWLKGVFAKGSD